MANYGRPPYTGQAPRTTSTLPGAPQEKYSAPYHGITLGGGNNWGGQVSLYRFHVEAPVTFERSIRVTIEHSHANKRSDDYSSVAYWYRAEPHSPFSILPVEQRVDRANT